MARGWYSSTTGKARKYPPDITYEEYVDYLSTGTSIDIDTLLDPAIGGHHSGQAEIRVNDFLFHDEDLADPTASPDLIDIVELITEMKQANITELESDIEQLPLLPSLPILSLPDILLHIKEVTCYLEALPVASLPDPHCRNQVLQMSHMVTQFQKLRLALQVYQHQ